MLRGLATASLPGGFEMKSLGPLRQLLGQHYPARLYRGPEVCWAAVQVPEPSRARRASNLSLRRTNISSLRTLGTELQRSQENETPKSGLRDQGPDWRIRSRIRDTETKPYLRNAAVPRPFACGLGETRLAGWGERTRTQISGHEPCI